VSGPAGVVIRQAGRAQGGHGEGHHDAVVAEGRDLHAGRRGTGPDLDPVSERWGRGRVLTPSAAAARKGARAVMDSEPGIPTAGTAA
jgi:hypothetical protein